MRGAILRRTMDRALESRAVVTGHLSLTVPAIAAILLVPFLGLRMFGPALFVYYVLAGMAVAWQWYSAVLPGWKSWVARKGAQDQEGEDLAHRSGLAWPRESWIGPFAFHTTAAAVCGIHLGPWLLSRWYVWILPLAGMSSHTPTGDDYLQHFELASIVPAFVVGYILSQRFRRLATYAWILPALLLTYKLLTFTEPYASILAPHSSTRFSYFFVIQRSAPTFTHGFVAGDLIRVVQQMVVVAPFYAGLAYSIGALAARHDIVKKLFGRSPRVQPESEIS
ncbi:MAG: hypothetical protein WAN76_23035 [Candidatus Sulfotelmatobacter sp.]